MTNDTSIVDSFVKMTAQEAADVSKACDRSIETLGVKVDYKTAGDVFLRQKIERVRTSWRKVCPPDYDATDVSRLPVAMLNDIMPINMDNGRGLFVFGKPASYKTRTVWLKLAMEFAEKGKRIRYLPPNDFAMKASWVMSNADTGCDWMEGMIHGCDILFIDDVFKNRMTEAQEFVLFSLVERRMSQRKSICFTSNTDFNDIPSRFTEKGLEVRADALMRRLDESCELLNV